MKPLTLANAVLLGAACSSTGSTGRANPDQVVDSALDSGSSEADDTEQPDSVDASWFGIEGTLILDEANPTVALTVHFYEDEPTGVPICSAESEAVGLVAHELTPDPTVHYWANTQALLSLTEEACPDIPRLPQSEIQLGLGTLHSELIPILEAQGLGDIAASSDTLGSYIGFNGSSPTEQNPGTAFVLGYALNEIDESGQLLRLSGTVRLHGLFLFPLEDLDTETGDATQ